MHRIKRGKKDISFENLIEDEPEEIEDKKKDDQRKRKNMLILLAASCFNMIGFGTYETAYSQWIYVRFENDVLGDDFSKLDVSVAKDPCFRGNQSDSPFTSQLNEAQAKAAHFGVLTHLCGLLPSLFANLLLGAYADQIGRRIIFIVPMAGNVIKAAIVCAVAYWKMNVNFLLVGFTIRGLTGDHVAVIMGFFVYTADNTSEGKNRSFVMILVNAVHYICGNLSKLASGYFIEDLGYVWPMITGMISMCIGFTIIVTFLPETLDKSKVKRVSFFEGIKGIFSFYFEKPVDKLHKRKDFILLGLVFFTYASSIGGHIMTIFLMNEPFCWGSTQFGYVQSAFGMAHAVLATCLMKLLQMCMSDEMLVFLTLLSSAGHRMVFAFAEKDWHIYFAYAIGALEVSALAVIRAILSRMVPQEKRGSLFASLAVMETAIIAASGASLNELYSYTVTTWRGLTFLVIGCITFISALLMMVYKIVIYRRDPPDTTNKSVELDTVGAAKDPGITTVSDGTEKVDSSKNGHVQEPTLEY